MPRPVVQEIRGGTPGQPGRRLGQQLRRPPLCFVAGDRCQIFPADGGGREHGLMLRTLARCGTWDGRLNGSRPSFMALTIHV